MAAHSEIADIVEEDDTRCATWVGWFAEQRADDGIRAARLVHYRGTESVEFFAKNSETLGEGSGAEIGPALDDNASGLASGVGVNCANAGRIRHEEIFVYTISGCQISMGTVRMRTGSVLIILPPVA